MYQALKPVKRSEIRVFFGKMYYRIMRYIQWYTSKKTYATDKRENTLPYTVFQHKTPLMRDLKGVDMWLQHNKAKNLKIAAEKVDRVLLKPGETFSYWRLIGNTTRLKGYEEGMILYYGKVKTGVGGGLCQLSNLVYWMTLHSPLTVTERYRHSYDVFPDAGRKQPFGSGATCAYNYLDLQILNETQKTFQLLVKVTDTHLVGEWRSDHPPDFSYQIYEKEHWITQEFWGDYIRHNKIHRKVYFKDGKDMAADEFVTENHALMMYEPMLQQKTAFVNNQS